MAYFSYLRKHIVSITVVTILFSCLGLSGGVLSEAIAMAIIGFVLCLLILTLIWIIKSFFALIKSGKMKNIVNKSKKVKAKKKTNSSKKSSANHSVNILDSVKETYQELVYRHQQKMKQLNEERLAIDQKQEEEQKKVEAEHQELLWQWQNADLSSFASKTGDIKLAKTEAVYFSTYNDISWKEERSKSIRINYGGLTGNIHIAKGLNYRLGSIKAQTQHEKYWKEIFRGRLLLTDRRIILVSHDGAKAYRFTRLLRVMPFSDATVLVSESGKQTILDGFLGYDAEEFNILLDRLTSN